MKFTIWQLDAKSGKLKSLQATSPKANKDKTLYVDSTKKLLLEAGTYYLSMEASNAKKGGSANYEVALNASSVLFSDGDNSDDWDDLKWNGENGSVGNWGELTEDFMHDDWVGYGDAIDYGAITLNQAGYVKFDLYATDAAKFNVWRLDESFDKYGNSQYSLKALQSTALKANWETSTGKLFLDSGTYYLSMESTNAKKGASVEYEVALSGDSMFINGEDNDNNSWRAVMYDDYAPAFEEISGWVGLGDTADFYKINPKDADFFMFNMDKETYNAVKGKKLNFTCVDANGKTVKLDDWSYGGDYYFVTDTFAGNSSDYYIGFSTPDQLKYSSTYNVTVQLAYWS